MMKANFNKDISEAKFFTRVITKPFSVTEDQRIPVAELDGVYVYLVDDKVIVTKEELYSF